MPELPEVEVVKKSLEKSIINLTIKSVKINDLNLRYKVKKHDFKKIIDLKILKIERKSKYLLFFFGKKFVMIVHLGMTGKFFINKNDKNQKTSFYYNNEDKNNKHDRVIFTLNKNLKLIYNDIRKFGFIKILLTKDISKNEHLANLGPEPMSHFFNYKYVKNYIVGKKKNY